LNAVFKSYPGIETGAAINPGNSVRALIDLAGRLIGVNTAIISQSESFAGIGFAVPVDVVKRVVPKLITNGKVFRPGIGIIVLDEKVAASNQQVKNIDEFIRVLEDYEIGQSITLDVRRGDQIRTVEVKIMDIS
jgi:2-alkenal reductase